MIELANTPKHCVNWIDTINISPEPATFRSRYVNKLKQIQRKQHFHLEQIHTTTHRVALFSPEVRLIHTVRCRAGRKAPGDE